MFLGPLLYLFSGNVVQVSPFSASVLLHIELNTLKLQSIQNNTKVNICNFSVFEVVTYFSFIAACSLSSASALFLVSLSYIGGRFSISISKTLHASEMSCLYHLKPFSIYLLHLKRNLLGNSMDINWGNSNAFEN